MDDLAGKLRAIAGTTPNQANGFNVLNASAREAISAAAEALERPTVGANVGAERKALEEIRKRILTGEYQGVFHDIDAIAERALAVGAEVRAGETSPEKSANTSVI